MALRHLRTLVAIADHKTFSEAAQTLRMTHAAVSQHVGALEDKMGVPLFDRKTRTPMLNATGHAMVAKARQLLHDYDSLVPSVLGSERFSGEVNLGAVPTILNGLAPRAILKLRKAHADLRVLLRPGLTAPLLTALERHQLDAAIVTRPLTLPAQIHFEPIAEEPLMLIASQELSGQDPRTLLSKQPFIRFNRDAVVGAQIEAWIQKHRIRVKEAMELDNLDAISSMVYANIGVSIVPRISARPFNPLPLVWLPLDDPAPTRSLGFAYHAGSAKEWALGEILRAFRSSTDQAAPVG